MKTIRLDEYNAIPAVREVAVAEPGPGEVLVRVTAAALNPLDVKLQRGYMHQFFPLSFPSAIGTDLSGVIERTGSLATRWRAGDKVIARLDPSVGEPSVSSRLSQAINWSARLYPRLSKMRPAFRPPPRRLGRRSSRWRS